MFTQSAAILILSTLASAEVSMYHQCGGTNWNGETNCASGGSCVPRNQFYYQCLPTANGEAEACGVEITSDASVAASTSSTSRVTPQPDAATTSRVHSHRAGSTQVTISAARVESSAQPATSRENAETSAAPAAPATSSSAPAPVQSALSAAASLTPSTLSTVYTSSEVAAPSSSSPASSSAAPVAVSAVAAHPESSSAAASAPAASAPAVASHSASASASAASSSASGESHPVSGGLSGTTTTTRYWDCCKPSCAWAGTGRSEHLSHVVYSCDIDGNVLSDNNIQSGCVDGGSAYMCNDQTPWVVSDTLAYGFAAAAVQSQNSETLCCTCMRLTFTDQLVGKEMILQITNTGGDMSGTNFDIALPGGGVGEFTQGCTGEFGDNFTWGQTYGGVDTLDACSGLPSALQPGCQWRFDDWFEGASNPGATYEQVTCPPEIIERSGCGRTDE